MLTPMVLMKPVITEFDTKRKRATQTQQACDDHHHTGEDRQGEQGPCGIVPRAQIHVGDDDRHRAGSLDRHERGAGEELGPCHPVGIGVQPREGVDSGEHAVRKSAGHALDADDQPAMASSLSFPRRKTDRGDMIGDLTSAHLVG